MINSLPLNKPSITDASLYDVYDYTDLYDWIDSVYRVDKLSMQYGTTNDWQYIMLPFDIW